MFQFILYSRFIWIPFSYFILHQIVAKSNKSELKYSFLQQIPRIFSSGKDWNLQDGKKLGRSQIAGGEEREFRPLWVFHRSCADPPPCPSLVPPVQCPACASWTHTTTTPPGPQGALHGKVWALVHLSGFRFQFQNFAKQPKHARTQYRRSSPRKPHWTSCPSAGFWLHASVWVCPPIEPLVMAFRSQNSLEIAIPAFLSPFVGWKTFQPAS